MTELLCPSAQKCSTTVITVTCRIKEFGLVWRVEGLNYTKLFTAADATNTTASHGPFTAVLYQTSPAFSSLFITPDPSMDGLFVDCLDGLYGGTNSCELNVISKIKMNFKINISS